MRLTILSVFSAVILCSCSMLSGSGRIVSELRNVGSFTEIESAGSLKIELKQGSKSEVQVEADDNILSHVETEVKNNRLIVSLAQGGYNNIHVTVFVTSPVIQKIIASGSGSIEGTGSIVNDGSIRIETNGSGSISAKVESPEVVAEANGSGSIELSGRTRNVKADNSGSGSIKCTALLSESAKVKNDGSGSVYVFASVSVDAELDGSGDIVYSGNAPTVHVDDEGSGSIRKQ